MAVKIKLTIDCFTPETFPMARLAEYLSALSKVVEFPRAESATCVAVSEDGELEGVVVRVGGKGEEAPVTLRDGDRFYNCTADRGQARMLAAHLYGDPVRLFGRGRWRRGENGCWELEAFKIAGFEEPDGSGFVQAFDDLRSVACDGWDDIADPLVELGMLRTGGGEAF